MKCTLLSFILFFSFLSSAIASTVCDDVKVSFFFEINSAELSEKSKAKLDSLNANLKGEFYIEIHGFSDSTGNAEANLTLSKKRAESVQEYLKIKKVNIFSFGEMSQENSERFYKNMSKNRRVDLIYLPFNNNRLSITGKEQAVVEIPFDENQLNGESICDCHMELQEIKTDLEASEAEIPLITTDDRRLTTGGMVKLDAGDCLNQKCKDSVKITLPWGNIDTNMTSWVSVETENGMRWESLSSTLKFDTERGRYIMTVPCELWERGAWINCDRYILGDPRLYVPPLRRWHDNTSIKSHINFDQIDDTTLVFKRSELTDTSFFSDVGLGEFCDVYYFGDTLLKNQKRENELQIPLSEYTLLQHSDTLLIFKSNEKLNFRTHLKYPSIQIDNEIYNVKSNFFEKLVGQKYKYILPIPLAKYYFTLNNRPLDDFNVKKKYNKRRNIYKYKLRNID
jgi:hypothetical protein